MTLARAEDLTGRVLIVDDDAAIGKVIIAQLAQSGLEAAYVASGDAALAALNGDAFDAVLTDVRMPGMSGLDLLDEMTRRWPELPVIMLTAFGNVPLAVAAMQRGASDFMLKPFDDDELLFAVRKALLKSQHRHSPSSPPTPLAKTASKAMRDVYEILSCAAPGTSTVLLRGETGSGKGHAARVLHDAGPRRDGPFVTVQCGALPDNLLESELFGYEKGAFTGATCRKPGRVELAKGGTLFLDEIGDVALAVQAKLLRLVQDRAFERLGSNETQTVDVRFVAATHRPLEEMIEARTFREDLFYRLNVVPVRVPSLRERPEDIESFARAFCATFATDNGKPQLRIGEDAIARLRTERWPGNVRQLQNFIERLVVLSKSTIIGGADVELALRAQGERTSGSEPPHSARHAPLSLGENRRDAERDAFRRALGHSNGNRSLAARLLGISRRTFYTKLAELELDD